MTKFSDFIRSPGTAGPPTQEGIAALGFVLGLDIPGILGKYVRVDAAQSFTNGEKTQARTNIGAVIGTDVQAFSTSLTSLAGLTTAADRLAYTTAADTWAVTPLTAFARTILDDTNAVGVRTTIGLGNVDNTSDANKPVSTATQTALDLKANLASPALTGNPTAPTAPPGDSDTTIATTAFVTAAVGAAAVFTKQYQSANQTITVAGQLILAHGLSAVPKALGASVVCLTAEGGYSVGDRVSLSNQWSWGATGNTMGVNITYDATNLTVRFGDLGVYIMNKTTGARLLLTPANWRLVMEAYA